MKHCYPVIKSNFICFSADTLVALPSGSCKEIARIKVGDSVLGLDRNSGRIMSVEVETVASSYHMHHVMLSLEDGTTLACTDDHPLWVNNKGWCVVDPHKAAENYGLATRHLLNGDKFLVVQDGLLKAVGLESTESIVRESRMWVIGTGSNHTFFANGVLAHDENVGSLDLSRARGVIVAKSSKRPSPEPVLA